MTLSPLTSVPKRKRFSVLDLESKDGASQRAGFTRPFMAGFYDGDSYVSFWDRYKTGEWDSRYWEEHGCLDLMMRHILTEPFRGTHIYAHNAGRFDYLFLIPWLMNIGRKLGFGFSILPMASGIQVLDVMRDGKKASWRFLDSLRLIPMSLDKADKTFGGEGKTSVVGDGLNTPEWEVEAWERYNRDDCQKLYSVLDKFHSYVEHSLGSEVGITAPSTSMKLFRRKYQKEPIQRHIDHHPFARESYFGGRVEVYRKAGKNLRYYDFNSSYPAAMLEPMPVGNAVTVIGQPPAKFLNTGEFTGICKARVSIPEDCNIPPLPYRVNGKLCFPVGDFEGVWDWSELELLSECGGSFEILESVWFEAAPVFEPMVRELYAFRDKQSPKYEPGLAEISKLMMNSLYGKFGMKPQRRKILILGCDEIPVMAKPATGDPDCLVWYSDEETDAPYIIPQIASHVTALARARLWRNMYRVERDGLGSVYYCDTDSMLTDAFLPSSSALGELKDEFPGKELEGMFVAPKVYMIQDMQADGWLYETEERDKNGVLIKVKHRDKVVAKGFNKEHRNLATLLKLAAGDVLQYERLEKLGSLARANFQRGPRMAQVSKSMTGNNDKRVFNADGSSRPIVVRQW